MTKKSDSTTASGAIPTPGPITPYARERAQFHELLLLNPNHFGNLEKSNFPVVLKIVGNTTFEQLTCVSFNPTLNLLEAHVQIKQPYGYGNQCPPGSTENVRFYVDYNDGAGWQDVGWVAFDVNSIPSGIDCAEQPNKPLSFVASLPFEPKRDVCGVPVLPMVRAILSWNLMPPANQPNWPPIWGNVVDQHIQIPHRPEIILDLVSILSLQAKKPLELPEQYAIVKDLKLPLPPPEPLPLAGLVGMYGGSAKVAGATNQMFSVEPHRFATADLVTASKAIVLDQQAIEAKTATYKALSLNYAEVAKAFLATQANVSYEEVECLGLDVNRSLLAATFIVKRPYGYSGDLCKAGSKEHIAFWVDWDNTCTWTYLDTVSIDVHDIDKLPSDGLAYSAVLKVNLAPHRRPCTEPKVARIRAVLSWSTPPSQTNPDDLTAWGNRLDTHVLIPPGNPVTGPVPNISVIGGIGIDDINIFGNGMTKPNATFAFFGTPADPHMPTRECPFGGLVTIQGVASVGYKYRVWVRNLTLNTPEVKVTHSIWVVNSGGVGSSHAPDANGFFTYLDDSQNIDDTLAYWYTSGDDSWAIRLEIADLLDNPLGSTALHNIQLDNTAPTAEPLLSPPTIAIHIDGGNDCKDVVEGLVISGHFVARDINFGGFSLSTEPNTIAIPSNQPTTATPATSQTAPFPGDAWTLDTGTPMQMKPCGYVVRVDAADRSIVGSQPGSHNTNHVETAFCLREKV